MLLVEEGEEFWGMQVAFRDPLVFGVGVSLPFDQVLECVASTSASGIKNLFYFKFLFSLD